MIKRRVFVSMGLRGRGLLKRAGEGGGGLCGKIGLNT